MEQPRATHEFVIQETSEPEAQVVHLPLTSETGVRHTPRYLQDAVKRVVDFVVAAVAIILLSPILLVAAVLVRRGSDGPAIFKQERVGRDGEPFTIYKFRTMYQDSDDQVHREYVTELLTAEEPPEGAQSGTFKLTDDPRITPIGGRLRQTSVDELPQLFNVLWGNMSLVGPRPSLPWEVNLFKPEHLTRFEVKPGITGLWQVSGRADLPMPEALALDVDYVERRSLRLDLSILVRTVPTVLRRRGAW